MEEKTRLSGQKWKDTRLIRKTFNLSSNYRNGKKARPLFLLAKWLSSCCFIALTWRYPTFGSLSKQAFTGRQEQQAKVKIPFKELKGIQLLFWDCISCFPGWPQIAARPGVTLGPWKKRLGGVITERLTTFPAGATQRPLRWYLLPCVTQSVSASPHSLADTRHSICLSTPAAGTEVNGGTFEHAMYSTKQNLVTESTSEVPHGDLLSEWVNAHWGELGSSSSTKKEQSFPPCTSDLGEMHTRLLVTEPGAPHTQEAL